MRIRKAIVICLVFFAGGTGYALEPDQILIIANSDVEASVHIARYYCTKRGVPAENILALPLGTSLGTTITRDDYEKQLAEPIRKKLSSREFAGKIRCLLTTYGVPIKVGGHRPSKDQQENLEKLQQLEEQKGNKLRDIIAQLELLGHRERPGPAEPGKPQSVNNMLKKLNAHSQNALARIESIWVPARRGPSDDYLKRSHLRKWLEYYGQLYGKAKAWKAARAYVHTARLVGAAERAEQFKKIQECRDLLVKGCHENWTVGRRLQAGFYDSLEQVAGLNGVLKRLNVDIDRLAGKETAASVDSELSMVLFGDYELYRWQLNKLKNKTLYWDIKTLMVCRLDGPGLQIAEGLVDKAIKAEKTGLQGIAYIDSRGIADDRKPYSPGYFDQSLRDLAWMIKTRRQMPLFEERTDALFVPGQCPSTALYCGWYSLKKYVDAFDFVDGAVGYHISSLEAVNLRDSDSSQWCPAMLKDGITATLGAVAEPYLHSFPDPRAFFAELFNDRCLVEAYYCTKPFNSWQLILIGDPLYRPFKNHLSTLFE